MYHEKKKRAKLEHEDNCIYYLAWFFKQKKKTYVFCVTSFLFLIILSLSSEAPSLTCGEIERNPAKSLNRYISILL